MNRAEINGKNREEMQRNEIIILSENAEEINK